MVVSSRHSCVRPTTITITITTTTTVDADAAEKQTLVEATFMSV